MLIIGTTPTSFGDHGGVLTNSPRPLPQRVANVFISQRTQPAVSSEAGLRVAASKSTYMKINLVPDANGQLKEIWLTPECICRQILKKE
jgi:hypothetical protein